MRDPLLGRTTPAKPWWVPVLSSIGRAALFIACGFSLPGACEYHGDRAQFDGQLHSLEGEWTFVASSPRESRGSAPATVIGRIVFNAEIPDYVGGTSPDVLRGRAYINRDALIKGQTFKQPFFADAENADVGEEVHATVEADSILSIRVAPRVFGDDLLLEGQGHGSVITGNWIYLSHSDTLNMGTFRMESTRKSAVSDSAIVRSRRAAGRWRN